MTKIDIFSGFLGAGKTTLIKKLIAESFKGEQLVIIENEFGEIGIDGGFLADSGITVNEMNSGCICCSLVGDFGEALKKVLADYRPDRILIEPSGVGKLSDVIAAVRNLELDDIVLNSFTTVADATKVKVYIKNFGEFYNNQIEHAGAIVLSRTGGIGEDKLQKAVDMLREINDSAAIITTPWDDIDGKTLLSTIEGKDKIEAVLAEMEHEHHHHHDEHCDCHDHEHHHHHDEHCDCHDHEHHHHEHHFDQNGNCSCGCHHDHHADEVFTSFGAETVLKYSKEQIEDILNSFDENSVGTVLRAKGIVACTCGKWIHFDYVPGSADVRIGSAAAIGRICVIGTDLDESKIKELFKLGE